MKRKKKRKGGKKKKDSSRLFQRKGEGEGKFHLLQYFGGGGGDWGVRNLSLEFHFRGGEKYESGAMEPARREKGGKCTRKRKREEKKR